MELEEETVEERAKRILDEDMLDQKNDEGYEDDYYDNPLNDHESTELRALINNNK